jgi:hypothetical protein
VKRYLRSKDSYLFVVLAVVGVDVAEVVVVAVPGASFPAVGG